MAVSILGRAGRLAVMGLLVVGCGGSHEPATSPADAAPDVEDASDVTTPDGTTPDVTPDIAVDDANDCDCDPLEDPCHTATCVDGICVVQEVSGDCDDGDPCTQGDFCLVGTCIGAAIDGCCTPDCEGKQCGDDGCDGTCGACGSDELCSGEWECVPQTAASDTCDEASPVGALPFEVTGSTVGLDNDYEAPEPACYNGSLGAYGPDAVYAYQADFDGFLIVSLSGSANDTSVYVAEDCGDIKYTCGAGALVYGNLGTAGPASAPVSAGKTYYVIVEGPVGGGTFTLSLDACVPECAGKECGLDGCGHWCAYCPKFGGWNCASNDTCMCLPDCTDKVCGDDGCGGSCGVCGGGETCGLNEGQCVEAGQTGDTCASAIPVQGSAFEYSGTTAGHGNDYYGWWACEGNGTNAYLGTNAPDVAFVLTPEETTTYYVNLEGTGFIPEVWALSDCSDPLSWIQCGYQGFTLKTQLFIEAPGGQSTYLIVSGNIADGGAYTLTVDACDAPGSCPSGEQGEYCSYPIDIAALPYEYSTGGIGGSVDSYHVSEGGSCGAPKGVGEGSHDDVFAFTAPADGTYQVAVDASGQFDPAIYVATECTDLATGCVAWADKTVAAGEELLEFAGAAGTTYYVIVDGFTPYGGGYSLSVTQL